MMNASVLNLLTRYGEACDSVTVDGSSIGYFGRRVNGDVMPHIRATGDADTLRIQITVAGCVSIYLAPDEKAEVVSVQGEWTFVEFQCEGGHILTLGFSGVN